MITMQSVKYSLFSGIISSMPNALESEWLVLRLWVLVSRLLEHKKAGHGLDLCLDKKVLKFSRPCKW